MRKIATLLVVAVALVMMLTAFAKEEPTDVPVVPSITTPSNTTNSTAPTLADTGTNKTPDSVPPVTSGNTQQEADVPFNTDNFQISQLVFFDTERENVEMLCCQQGLVLVSVSGTAIYASEQQVTIDVPNISSFTIEFAQPHSYQVGDTIVLWLALTNH